MARPVKTEMERIEKLLARDDLTNKQRFALMIAHAALKWQTSLTKGSTLERPSTVIMRNSDKKT